MERIAKIILSFVDLAEVEIQSLKKGIVRLAFTLIATVGGGVLAFIGLCLVLAAGFIALENAIGRVGALALVGAVFLGTGGFLLISSWRRGTKTNPATAIPAAPVAATTAASSGVSASSPLTSPSTSTGANDDASLRIAS